MFIQGIASLGQIATSVVTAAVLSVATAVGGQGTAQDTDRIETVSGPEDLPDLSPRGSRATRFAGTAPSFSTKATTISRPVVRQAGLGGWFAALGLLGLAGLIASKMISIRRASFALQKTRLSVPPVLPQEDQELRSLAADIRTNNLGSTGLARLISILGAKSNRANVALTHLFDFLPTQDPDSFEMAAVWQTLQAIASDPSHLLHDDVHLRLQRLARAEKFTNAVFRIYGRMLADPKTREIAERELRDNMILHGDTLLAGPALLLLCRAEGKETAPEGGSSGGLGV